MTKTAAVLHRGLLSEADAALWLGISASKLRGLPIRRRVLDRRRLYDLRDLEAFRDALPYEGEDGCEDADRAFGCAG